MMKKILLFLLLAVFTLGISAQGPSKKCPVCGLSIPKCQYKGKHPKATNTSSKQNPTSKQQRTSSGPKTGTHNGHEWVDLGLPSGVKWATCNIDAESPYELGSYYRRTETFPAKIGVFETSENYKVDVARTKWGGRWRLPTKKEIIELTTKCKIVIESKKGQNWIYRVTGPNKQHILLIAGDNFLWDIGAPRDRNYYGGPACSADYLASTIELGEPTILAIDPESYKQDSNNIVGYKGWRLSANSCGHLVRPVFK